MNMWDEIPFIDEDEPIASRSSGIKRKRETPYDATLIVEREKWERWLSNWSFFAKKHGKEITKSCRKGIPSLVRGRAWLHLSGGQSLLENNPPNQFKALLKQAVENPAVTRNIQKDLHAQWPFYESSAGSGPDPRELFSVLRTYAVFNGKLKYHEGQGSIAAFLLIHMPIDQSYYCFISICDKYVCKYNSGEEAVQRDGDILMECLRYVSPIAYSHLKRFEILPKFFISDWFTGLYTRTLPLKSLRRVWDMFLCEGASVIFKVALALMKGCLGTEALTQSYPTMGETIRVLRNLPDDVINEKALVSEIEKLNPTLNLKTKEEEKWKQWLSIWPFYQETHGEEIKESCRQGIPESVRAQAWLYFSGGQLLMKAKPKLFQLLVKKAGDPKVIEDIRKDLPRQSRYLAKISHNLLGEKNLFEILKGYSNYNSQIGYFQAQAPIASFLLTQMTSTEAFCCFTVICEKYLNDYAFSNPAIFELDGSILMNLLKKVSITAYSHLVDQEVVPDIFITVMATWFTGLYTRTLPYKSAIRVWDMFLCEGNIVIFKVAVVLIKNCLGTEALTKRYATKVDIFQVLQNPPDHIVEENALVSEIQKLDFDDAYEDYAEIRDKEAPTLREQPIW
ncbi:ecotropic viral integration site 5 ortholog-like [Venturia canescens]|uniref:ecotropic viral integration site 5 ortholog-like n=1 Tax=Venturia canescens TaxID=32260 RepID=UPI001C9C8717|nr:ecotropic viral integration site 5 ortholog-like [Venturia canescens]